MNQDILYLILLAGSFLTLFGFAEFLYHKMKVKSEITRKFVHVGTGLLTLLFPVLLSNHWLVLALCASFLVILLASLKFNLLPSINAIDRVSHGSILYPVAVYGVFLFYTLSEKGLIAFYLPILILALCDPIAALIGKKYPFVPYHIGPGRKTLSGSLAFFVSALIITTVSFYSHEPSAFQFGKYVPSILLISLTGTIFEAVSSKGRDNLSIPAGVALSLSLIL